MKISLLPSLVNNVTSYTSQPYGVTVTNNPAEAVTIVARCYLQQGYLPDNLEADEIRITNRRTINSIFGVLTVKSDDPAALTPLLTLIACFAQAQHASGMQIGANVQMTMDFLPHDVKRATRLMPTGLSVEQALEAAIAIAYGACGEHAVPHYLALNDETRRLVANAQCIFNAR